MRAHRTPQSKRGLNVVAVLMGIILFGMSLLLFYSVAVGNGKKSDWRIALIVSTGYAIVDLVARETSTWVE